jgi:hypothetical protein
MSTFENMFEAVAGKDHEVEYKMSFESMGEILEKKQAGLTTSVGRESNNVSKWALASTEEIRKCLKKAGLQEGMNETYVGLVSVPSTEHTHYANSIIKANIIDVSYELAVKCIDEIQHCKWSDANLEKFRRDQMAVGRRNQEKTIDFPKKCKKFDSTENAMKFAQALSLLHMNVSLASNTLIVEEAREDREDIVVIDDDINKLRNAIAKEYKSLVENKVIPRIATYKMPAEIREEINMLIYNAATAPVIEMKAYYNDISGGYRNVRDLYNIADDEYAEEDDGIPSVNVAKENYTNDKARIENMIRMITRDISDEDRGAIIKLIAGITKNNTEKETESRIALSLCNPEYLLFLVKCGLNEMDFAGYELLGNNKYKIGDTVYFRNGQAAHAIIKCDKYPYTGWLEIKEFNGRLYGAIDLKSLISVPKITNQIIIKVKQSFVDCMVLMLLLKLLVVLRM